MSSLKQYNNSNLASSNMVNVRRKEAENLERQRLEVNRKLENLMKKYARVTGDRKVIRRRRVLGLAPNDWSPAISVTREQHRPLLMRERIALVCALVVTTLVAAFGALYLLKPEFVLQGIEMLIGFVKGLIG